MKQILVLILCVSGMLACFKKSDPCEGSNCSNGQTCLDGKCDCPLGSYKLRNVCEPKTNDTYLFASKGCFSVPDTFTLKITPQKNDNTKVDVAFRIPYLSTYGGGSIIGDYFSKSSGDSIRILTLFSDVKIGGKLCWDEVMCKKINASELKVQVRYYEPNNYTKTVDKCEFTMKK